MAEDDVPLLHDLEVNEAGKPRNPEAFDRAQRWFAERENLRGDYEALVEAAGVLRQLAAAAAEADADADRDPGQALADYRNLADRLELVARRMIGAEGGAG